MSIMIGLPCHGGIVTEKTTTSLFNLGKLLVRNSIPHGLLTQANSSIITMGRSKIANFFINNTKHEYLFFLDSDIGFNPEDVIKMIDYNLDIVCGTYPMKTIPIRYCTSLIYPKQTMRNLVKITGNGMGFCLIKRSVFEKISECYPELKYTPPNDSNYPISSEEYNNSYHYFMEEKNGDSYMSEDMSFFHRSIKVGFDVWLDPDIKLQHLGSHVFE